MDRAGQLGERGERRRRGEHPVVVRERAGERPERGHGGQQISQPERAVGDEQGSAHGQEGSVAGATNSSLTSQPGGWRRAKMTVRATSSGRLSRWSAAGLNSSGRSSKKCVCMPPGMSSVTPTRSPVSAASARVKPTTPNLLAQYAVAAGSALTPSVDATVTT